MLAVYIVVGIAGFVSIVLVGFGIKQILEGRRFEEEMSTWEGLTRRLERGDSFQSVTQSIWWITVGDDTKRWEDVFKEWENRGEGHKVLLASKEFRGFKRSEASGRIAWAAALFALSAFSTGMGALIVSLLRT